MIFEDIDIGEVGKKVLIWFIPLLVIIGVVRYCISGNDFSLRGHDELSIRGHYIVNTDCYGAFSRDAMNDLVRNVVNNNRSGFAIQLARNELISLSEGTQVILTDYGMTMCKVDILSGPYAGNSVYVLTEFIQ